MDGTAGPDGATTTSGPEAPERIDGVGPATTVTVQVYGTAVRTPVPNGGGLDNVYNESLLDPNITNLGEFVDRYGATSEGFSIGANKFRASRDSGGSITVEMALVGGDKWVDVYTGKADHVVKGAKTYEWDVGGTGAVSGQFANGEEGVQTDLAGPYSRLKLFNQFWVFEKPPNGTTSQDTDYKSFRARSYFPVPVLTGIGDLSEKDPGATLGANYWVDLRWGRMEGIPSPDNPVRLSEWGVNFNVGASGSDALIRNAANGNWTAVADGAIAAPKLGAQLVTWQTGLFGLKGSTEDTAKRIEGPPPAEGSPPTHWTKSVPARIVRGIGQTYQHWALVAALGTTVGASATTSNNPEIAPPDSTVRALSVTDPDSKASGVPTEFAPLLSQLEGLPALGPVQEVLDTLEQVDLSKYSGLIDTANTAISTASAAKAVVDLLKGRGLNSVEALSTEQKDRLFGLIMDEAARLTVEDSFGGLETSDVAQDAQNPLGGPAEQVPQSQQGNKKSLLMLDGETTDEYVARLVTNLGGNLGEAALNVLSDESTYDRDLKLPKQNPPAPPPPPPSGPGAGGAGAGAGAGAGGVGGIVGGIAGGIAGAATLAGELLTSGGDGTDPATGNPELLTALSGAQTVLDKASKLIGLLEAGQDIPDRTREIETTFADLEAAYELLFVAVRNNPSLDPSTSQRVGEVEAGLKLAIDTLANWRDVQEPVPGVPGGVAPPPPVTPPPPVAPPVDAQPPEYGKPPAPLSPPQNPIDAV